jgi:hypothetical protein
MPAEQRESQSIMTVRLSLTNLAFLLLNHRKGNKGV